MATKLVNTDSLAETLGAIAFFAEGADESYVSVSAEQVDAIKAYVAAELPETAAEKLEPIENLEALLDAATDGLDESVELDLSELFGFKRENGAIRRVTPPRLVATKEGAALVCGSVVVPVAQEGNVYRLGRLVATGDSGFEKGERQTQNGPIYFPTHRFVDESDKTIFRINLYAKQGDMDALGLALLSGEPLSEVLAPLGQGGGGAKRMKDFVTADTVLPFEAPIVAVNRFESKSQYSKDGFSYSFVISAPEGRVSLWAQGNSESFLMANYEAAQKKANSGSLKFKVTDRKDPNGDNSKVSVVHSILDTAAGSFFERFQAQNAIAPGPAVAEIAAAKTAAAAPHSSGDVPAAAAAVVEEPTPVAAPAPVVVTPEAEAAPAAEPARATRASAFKRAAAASKG
jgi:hypothetical protein